MSDNSTPTIDRHRQTEIESAVARKMMEHFRRHPQVQNIDMMNLAYFCRNCLSKWYRSAAAEVGVAMTDEQARAIVYGMPYSEYKTRYGEPASAEQLKRFDEVRDKATE